MSDDCVTPKWGLRMPDEDEDTDRGDTSPFDLPVTAHTLNQGAAAARRNGRDPDAPITLAEFDARMRAVSRRLRNEQTTERGRQIQQLNELLSRPSQDVADELAKDLSSMREDYRRAKWILGIVGAPLMALSVWAMRELITDGKARAALDATTELRIQRLESAIDNRPRHEP